VAGSYGTLGVVTRVGMECEPAGRFVRVAYSRHGQLDDALAHVKRICRYGQPPDLPPGACPCGSARCPGMLSQRR
jgi:FAD/FMN-containing dehydrogenase